MFADALNEVKDIVENISGRFHELEKREVGCSVLTSTKLDALHQRMDNQNMAINLLTQRVEKIEDFVPGIRDLLAIKTRLIIVSAIGGFLGTAIGGLVIAYLFSSLVK